MSKFLFYITTNPYCDKEKENEISNAKITKQFLNTLKFLIHLNANISKLTRSRLRFKLITPHIIKLHIIV